MLTPRQRWWISGIAVFALAIGLITFSFGGGEKGPHYDGKSLQEWFDLLEPDDMSPNSNFRAILAIGKDAVPFLVQELRASESRWLDPFRHRCSQLGLIRRPYSPAHIRRMKASYCLIHLGPRANSALPELILLAGDDSHPSAHAAIGLLGYFRSDPTTVVPALQRLIANPRAPGLQTAINALTMHGTNARPALPRLKEMQTDVGIPVQARIQAASARVSIDPADRESLDFIVAQWGNTNAPRRIVVVALSRLGTNALPALPAMRRMAQSGFDTELCFSLSNSIQWLEAMSGMEPSGPR